MVKDVRIGSMVDTLEKDVDPTGFHGLRFLKLVHSDDRVDVYRVVGRPGGRRPPTRPASPGWTARARAARDPTSMGRWRRALGVG